MTTSNPNITPDITIVVCTYNRAAGLKRALASLTQLVTGGRFCYEILVVDNASTDQTPQAVEEIGYASLVPVRWVYEAKQGISFARNRGVAEAEGTWIAFFDDDQLAEPDWLLELFAIAEEKQSRCVGGSVRLQLPESCERELAAACRPLLGESPQLPEPAIYGRKMSPGTGNLMLHRDLFGEVGVFNEEIAVRGEDSDLFERIAARGIESWYTPRAVVWHLIPEERLTDSYLLKIARISGWGPAKQDLAERGFLMLALLWLARIARAFLLFLPKLIWTLFCGDREAALGLRCRLANTIGYTRSALALLGPERFGIEGYKG